MLAFTLQCPCGDTHRLYQKLRGFKRVTLKDERSGEPVVGQMMTAFTHAVLNVKCPLDGKIDLQVSCRQEQATENGDCVIYINDIQMTLEEGDVLIPDPANPRVIKKRDASAALLPV